MNEDTAKEIKDHYVHGRGSIQDLARIYQVSVDAILELVGEGHLSTVTFHGDMIDQSEAGNVTMNHGETVKVPFDLS
jgi:hypothetical protein